MFRYKRNLTQRYEKYFTSILKPTEYTEKKL